MGVFDALTDTPFEPAGGVASPVSSLTATPHPVASTPFSALTNKPFVAGQETQQALPEGYTPFQGKEPTGTFLGISDETDPYSKRPYFAYKLPGATSTTTDKTRTAPGTNPEVAAPTAKTNFENPRMPESASQDERIKQGATSDDQLDHRMALAIGGSNDEANLKSVLTSENQAASTDEGAMAQKVADGAMSLFQAQTEEAKNKGLPTPFVDVPKKAGILSSFANAPADSLTGLIRNTVLGLPKAAATVASSAVTGIKGLGESLVKQYTDPSPLEQQMEAQTPSILHPALVPVMRTLEPMVEPLVTDISAGLIFNQPDLYKAYVDNIQKNGPNAFTEAAQGATEKTPLQVVGDTAQAVLGAYLPDILGSSLDAFADKGIVQGITTSAMHGAAAGATFGAAQAASSGSTDPKELAAIVLKNAAMGALLSATSAGVIHGTVKSVPHIVDAFKEAQAAGSNRGFAKNPFAGLAAEGDEPGHYNPLGTPESRAAKFDKYLQPAVEDHNGAPLPDKVTIFKATNSDGIKPNDFVATDVGHAKSFLGASDLGRKLVSMEVPRSDLQQVGMDSPFGGTQGELIYKPTGKANDTPAQTFDEEKGGVINVPPETPVRNRAELEDEVKNTKEYLEYVNDEVNRHPAKELLKYYGNQNPRNANLDDIFAKNVERGTGAKSSKLDSRVTELGYNNVRDAQEGVEQYLDLRDRAKELTENLKGLQGELKDVTKKQELANKDESAADRLGRAGETQRRAEQDAADRAKYIESVKNQDQVPGLTRRVVEDRNGNERLTADPLANPSNFYQRMAEIKQGDPDRSLNEMHHISREDVGGVMDRMKARAAAAAEKSQAIDKSRNEMPRRLSFKDKVKGKLYPISSLPDSVKEIATKWQRGQLGAVELANKEREDLPGATYKIARDGTKTLIKKSPLDVAMPPDEAVQYYTAIQHGKFSPLRAVFDRLFEYAKRQGLELPYHKNYLPQVYREPLGEIKSSIVQYMRDQGVDEDTAEAYVQGVMRLPEDTAMRLKINPSFTKEKVFPTYGVAAKYGLTPKFTNPADLVANYRYELERSLGNKNFINELIDKGQLLPSTLRPEHWEHVTTNFAKGDMYAPPELAHMLNELYKDDATMGIWDTAVHYLGLVSRKTQELTLSGAIPYTNVHFFSAGQLIKEMTAGNFKAIQPFIRANSLKATEEYFRQNQMYSDMMARQGIDISNRMGSIKQIYQTLSHSSSFLDKVGIQFRKAFLDKSFGTFLPSLYLQVFKDTYDHAISKGMDSNTAEKFAGSVTQKNFGLLGTEARAKATGDSLSAVFFAPQFRESVFGTLANAGRSVTSEVRNPEFYRSRRLVAGMVLTGAMYQVFNKLINGQYTWQNPNGHEFELRIPLAGGNNMYIPWMPSFLALPRAAATGAISLAKGDFPTAEQQAGNFFSLPLQVAIQVLANKDYFGNPIYKDTDDGLQRSEKIGAYVGLAINHPYVKAVSDMITKKQPIYQTLSEAATLPVKFQKDSSISQGAFYDALQNSANKHATSSGDISSTYDQVQQLIAKGDKDGAQKIVDGLSDDQYKEYQSYKKGQQTKNTTAEESTQYAQYKQIQDLVASGKTSDAQKIIDGMTDEQYHIYTLLKKRFPAQ